MRLERLKGALTCAIITATLIVMTAHASVAANDSGSSDDGSQRKWTIAMYWASDNNLDEYTDYFVSLWQQYLTNREDVALCVFLDRVDLPSNISTVTEEGWVEVANLGEANSSSPDTLQMFIEYALTEPTLASENFMLMVQNHGNGYLGICSDEVPEVNVTGVWMSIDGLGQAVNNAMANTDKAIDIIALDACTLATVEIAYELRNTASYLVASQLGVPFDGMNYIELLSGLSENPTIEPLDLACKMVDDYEAWYTAPLGTLPTLYPYLQDFASLSVIDLEAVNQLEEAFETFTQTVLPKDNTLGYILRTAAVQADVSLWENNMGTWFYPDIRIMFADLADSTRDTHPEVASACDAILIAADDTVLYDWASWRMRGLVTGLSVFVCPSIGIFEQNWDTFDRAYDSVGLDFVDDSNWDEVLTEYFYTVKQYGEAAGA